MMPTVRMLLPLAFVCGTLPLTFAQDAPDAGSAEEVRQWVAALESDTYAARHSATERLILAGAPAIEPVAQAIEQGGLETIIRGIYILRQQALATSEPRTEAAAYEALKRIADRRVTTASRRAATAVQALDEVRQRRAQQLLEQQGAVFSMTQVQIGPRISQPYPSILIGESWRGRVEDLERLAWITKFRALEDAQPWMIALQGPKVTDAWVERLKTLENVRVVQLKSASISDQAMAHLKEMPELQFLEILYNPITDAGLPDLASLKSISRIKLYGTRVTPAAVQQLQQQLVGVDIDYRRGGFLGIGCEDNPCRVTTVREGTAAATAGLQMGDIVTRYNGQPVRTMDELTALIAQNSAGETVQIEVLRDGEQVVVDVVLGEWE